MKKLISIFMLTTTLAFGDFYSSIGFGPLALNPCVGIGFRDEFNNDVYDISFQYSLNDYYDLYNVSLSWLLFSPNDNIYLGPQLGVNYIDDEDFGHWFDQCFGLVIGYDFGNNFIDMSYQKEISKPKIRITSGMTRIRFGVKF